MTDIDTATSWRGHEVVDRDGDKIGRLVEIYLDLPTGEPQWALVKSGLIGSRQSFVPIERATAEEDIVRVPYEKRHVEEAPSVEEDGQLSQTEEAELYRHYGLEYDGESSSGSASGERPGSAERGDEHASTDEHATTGTEPHERERERVRLKKYVVTEHVTKTVPVQREEVRLEREPASDDTPSDR